MEWLRQNIYAFRDRRWRIYRKLGRKSVTVRTKQGLFTVSCADGGIGYNLYCFHKYELELSLNVMKVVHDFNTTRLKGKGTIVDVGANIGVTSLGMIHNGLVEKAIAIEPDPHNFSLLKHNVGQNGLRDSFICLPFAVSDAKGTVILERCNTNYAMHRVKRGLAGDIASGTGRPLIRVECDSLDHVVSRLPKSFTEEIAVIWIDVEGFEGYVFEGSPRIFSRGIPVVAEVNPVAMRHAGMSQEQFCDIASERWSTYWTTFKDKFIRRPISDLAVVFDELDDNEFTNLIFMP